MTEVEPTDVVGDAIVGTQRVPLIEAKEVPRRGFHQREMEIERRSAGDGQRRIEHIANRLAFERVDTR